MRRGEFYEDDEPVADVLAAFDAGEPCVTAEPARGWTYFMTADGSVHPLSTEGSVLLGVATA